MVVGGVQMVFLGSGGILVAVGGGNVWRANGLCGSRGYSGGGRWW